jgi:microcystin-dependent protein
MKLGLERIKTLAELVQRLTVILGQIVSRITSIEENGVSGGAVEPANLDDKIPVGSIQPFAGNTASVPNKWLLCDGGAISRSTYPQLFSIIGTTYGTGDGSTTFNLPDLRGEFIRGLDDGRGVDSGRTLGSSQSDELGSHNHDFYVGNTGAAFGHLDDYNQFATADPAGSRFLKDATSGSPDMLQSTGGSETRPRNVAMNYIIRVDVDTRPAPVAYEIPDGSITTAKLADDAVTSAKLADDIDFVNMPSVSGTSIIESGSNSDGRWTKFSDGTMICYGEKSVTSAINVARGSLYIRYTSSITFPETFDSAPSISVEHLSNSGTIDDREFWATCGVPSTTEVSLCLWSPISVASATHVIGFTAVGRWA